MSLNFAITIDDAVSPRISAFEDGLENRSDLHARIAEREDNLVRDWFAMLSQTRHKTAFDLGATPSGFWESAYYNTSYEGTEDAAVVSINHPGIGRVDHDVTITPGAGHKFLTIPLIAAAYNQRAYLVPGLFVLWPHEPGKSPVLASHDAKTGEVTAWYALVESVTLHQDRSLLPPDQAFQQEALTGIRDYVDQLLSVKEAT